MRPKIQKWAAIGAALIMIGMFGEPVAARAAADTAQASVASLSEGKAAFWEGSFTAAAPHAAACPAAGGEACADYGIDVTEAGWRLRVALDRPYGGGGEFSLALLDPSGREHASTEERVRDALQGGAGLYSVELFALAPAVGRWTARVTARSVTPDGFHRMRAKLEAEPKAPKHPRRLLPNLQPVAPFELTFANPTPDSNNGCRIDERSDYGAKRCLRFSGGPANVGDGPLDLRYGSAALEGPVFQRIHSSDGSYEEVPGGTYHYHLNHLHYHHDGVGEFELHRVEANGKLTQVGEGPKVGFCMYDYLIADWKRFDQDRVRDQADAIAGCGNLTGPNGAALGLARGWGDIYIWQTPGNFVDFGDNGDGEYVVRMASDADGSIVETNDDDNLAYAHIKVAGDHIEVLERGIGTGPGDPHKVIVNDTRLPTAP